MTMMINKFETWGEFEIGNIFDIKSSKSGIDKNKLVEESGNVPYITRTNLNNGVETFIGERQRNRFQKDKGNAIIIGLDTQTIFYQEKSFYTGQNIQVLRNSRLNKYNAFYIIPLLKKQMKKFNWGGNGATLTRLKRTKIILPVDQSNDVCWGYMENYIEEKENRVRKKIINFLGQELAKIDSVNEISLDGIKWSNFIVEDYFDNRIGKSLDANKLDVKSGRMSYVTRKTTNNGIDGFLEAQSKKYLNEDFPVITIGNETAKPFLQNYPFYTGTKVNCLRPKEELSEYALLFFIRCLENVCKKYSYSFTINSTRLKKQKVLLPINDDNEPDWEFMSNYMRYIMSNKIKQTIKAWENISVFN
ncbi:hypothetical protein Plano_0081 [Planococcus sp. PAMC 21323]|uniref:restriction endonuclease subunit S n=1 Tax=Planococcus sp. PAMC 21323 TaxID=1526927 RepID=UPI00056DB32C|nr:restriction endonuclease subunit S [Planococcus sp. PAMC 21323]AIY04046.1 hypothetical protein Plano_0081 [Planococcus sp. PAMC 21323]